MNNMLINSNPLMHGLLGLAGVSLLAFSTATLAAPPVPTLNTPYNGQTNVPQTNVKFTWSSLGATSYRIVISQNTAFSGFVDANGSSACKDNTCYTIATTLPTYTNPKMDLAGQTYYWKVRANNATGASAWSNPPRSFITAGIPALTGASLVFPSSGSGWQNDFGSAAHKLWTCNASCSKTVTLDDINALDLNLNIPTFNLDAGKSVNPIANGTIFATSKVYGFILIKHTTPLRLDDGTILNTWYSGYMHMNNRTKIVGDTVTTTTSIGNISSVGADNSHLHIAIYKEDGTTLSSIKIRSSLSAFGSKFTGKSN